MGVYIKTGDDAKYYHPQCLEGVDSATDRADEIAVGSNGGGKGYIPGSSVQDTPMSLTVANKNLLNVSQGFSFLLGTFSNVWAGAGSVKLKLTKTDNKVLFKEFLTDKPLSAYNYVVELIVVDNADNVVARELVLKSSDYDSIIGKHKHTFGISADELTFGTDQASTPLMDLSKVSVYLRGYFYEEGNKHIAYDGGGIELVTIGGTMPVYLRGFNSLHWSIPDTSFASIDRNSGVFESNIEYMPKSEPIKLTVPRYASMNTALRVGLLPVVCSDNGKVMDYIAISQSGLGVSNLNLSMRTIWQKSPAARNFKFEIFDAEEVGWEIIEKPDWITASSSSGSGDSVITLGFAANDSGEARGGVIRIRTNFTWKIYEVACVQWGIDRFHAVENIVTGQPRTIVAYAATIAKNAFEMEVSYYNAPSFVLYLRQIGFNIADFAAGSNGLATLNMKSGACGGRDFNITNCEYDGTNDRWRLTLDRLEDSSIGMLFPNISFPIAAGDRFVITDILMPEVYIIVAGKKLLAKARVYYEQHSKLKYLFDLEIDSKWVHGQNGVYLRPGMYVQIADADLIGGSAVFILIDTITVTHNESNLPVFKVTLREKLYLPE